MPPSQPLSASRQTMKDLMARTVAVPSNGWLTRDFASFCLAFGTFWLHKLSDKAELVQEFGDPA